MLQRIFHPARAAAATIEIVQGIDGPGVSLGHVRRKQGGGGLQAAQGVLNLPAQRFQQPAAIKEIFPEGLPEAGSSAALAFSSLGGVGRKSPPAAR